MRRSLAGEAGEEYEEPEELETYEGYDEEDDNVESNVDLVLLASLSPWLSDGIKRIGRKRVKAVLDIYASMGGIGEDLKEVLVQIVDLDDTEAALPEVTVQDSMHMLIELDELMWRGRQDWKRAALMAMLSSSGRFGR